MKNGKQKVNLQEDEDLAIEVKKFVCLYDKTSTFYKRAKANAWTKVEESLGLEEGKHVFIFRDHRKFIRHHLW